MFFALGTAVQSSSAPLYSYEIKQGVKWLKVYHQKTPNFFSSPEDAVFSLEENKFSILRLIDEKYHIYDRYEFMIEYPDLGVNRWLQSNSPLIEENIKSGKAAEGFEAVHLKWEKTVDNFSVPERFHGLGLSESTTNALIDGTHRGWFFAIGQFNNEFHNGAIAGPFQDGSIHEVYLWMRVQEAEDEFQPNSSSKSVLLNLLNIIVNNE